MSKTKSKFTTYTLRGLPPGMFGESYVVVTGSELLLGTFRAEHFIFLQRPVESLFVGQPIEVATSDFPPDFEEINIDFAMTEALRQAEIDLLDLIEKRGAELERPDLAYSLFELREHPSPFVGCQMRGRFTKQLLDVKAATKCPHFSLHLAILQQTTFVRNG